MNRLLSIVLALMIVGIHAGPLIAEDLAFSVGEFLSRIDGPKRLTEEGAQACWSPNGLRIAYSYMPGGEDRASGGGVMILTLGESRAKRLTADGKYPEWSPDGRWIAFVRAGYEGMLETIWIVRSNGQGRPFFIAEGGYPQWKPNSREIVYHSREINAVCLATLDGETVVGKKKLFDLSFPYPRLSPNGEEIAFVLPTLRSYFKRSEDAKEYVVVISDLKQNLLRQRTIPNQTFLGGWSKDSRFIAFGGVFSPVGLNVVDAGLQAPSTLLLEGTYSRPSWSPDGRFIAFDTMEDGNMEIWIVRHIKTVK